MPAAAPTRVLLITRNLPPLVGGMERLNWHMAEELSQYAQVHIIGPKGAAATQPENTTLSEATLKPLPLFMLVAFIKALWAVLRFRPTIVLAGSGLTAPLAYLAGKLRRAKTAAYLHGFDITVASKTYQTCWVPFFKRMDKIIVNSTPTHKLALAAGVTTASISIVHPGVSLPQTPQTPEAIQAFKQQHGLENKKVLLSVGRLTTRKGLKEFVEHALPDIVKTEPRAQLVIVGDTAKDALGAGMQTQGDILTATENKNIKKHIQFVGRLSEQELVYAYESADLHVFPVRHIPGDPEGFGMVAVESAAHGLPTVAFATGGVIDAVADGRSGYLVPAGDYAKFAHAVSRALQNRQQLAQGCLPFAKQFAWPQFGQKIWAALRV